MFYKEKIMEGFGYQGSDILLGALLRASEMAGGGCQ